MQFARISGNWCSSSSPILLACTANLALFSIKFSNLPVHRPLLLCSSSDESSTFNFLSFSLASWPFLYCLVKQTLYNDRSCIAWSSKPPAMTALVLPGQASLLQWPLLYCLVKQASCNGCSCISWSSKPPAMTALVFPGQASLLQWSLLYCLVKQASYNGCSCISWSNKPPAMVALVLPGQASLQQ